MIFKTFFKMFNEVRIFGNATAIQKKQNIMFLAGRSAQIQNSEETTPFQPTIPTTQTASRTTTNGVVLTRDLTQQHPDDNVPTSTGGREFVTTTRPGTWSSARPKVISRTS